MVLEAQVLSIRGATRLFLHVWQPSFLTLYQLFLSAGFAQALFQSGVLLQQVIMACDANVDLEFFADEDDAGRQRVLLPERVLSMQAM